MNTISVENLIEYINKLPSDDNVQVGTKGYNLYSSQKDHWLGWLDSKSTSGTYQRKESPGRDAKFVYNHIMEPKMLLWLISASGLQIELVEQAKEASLNKKSMASSCAAIRKVAPWQILEMHLNNQ
jgi:hypothetical protein